MWIVTRESLCAIVDSANLASDHTDVAAVHVSRLPNGPVLPKAMCVLLFSPLRAKSSYGPNDDTLPRDNGIQA
jgi:hypothetical protein